MQDPRQLEYELEDDDAMYSTRRPSSARRYQPPIEQDTGEDRNLHRQVTHVPPRRTAIQAGTYMQGNTKVHVHYGAPPGTNKRGRTTEEPQTQQGSTSKRKLHPLLYLGIGMLGMLLLWVGLSYLVSWVNYELDTINYGMPRTYQIDGVINQNGDSPSNPTHIIFLNLNRKIEVIVQPAGDASKAHIYVITTLLEAGSELFPVKGYVKDLGNGKPDIVVIINNSGRTALINTGTDFRLLQPGDNPKY